MEAVPPPPHPHPPAVAAGALMYFFHHSFYLQCLFSPLYNRQRGLFFKIFKYFESELRVFGCLPAGGSRSPPQKKEQNVESACSDLRTVPLHLARKRATSLLRSRAISTTDDTLMDAMEDQHASLASRGSAQPTNVSRGLINLKSVTLEKAQFVNLAASMRQFWGKKIYFQATVSVIL